MTETYQDDLQDLDVDEDKKFWKNAMDSGLLRAGGPHRWSRKMLLMGAVSASLLLSLIIAMSVSNAKTQSKLSELEGSLANLSSSVKTELQAVQTTAQKANEGMTRVKSSLEDTVAQLLQVSESVRRMDELDILKSYVSELRCFMDKVKNNKTSSICCPSGWLLFDQSCYFMSAERLPWDEARDYCVGKGGYLAILKSPQERGFVSRRTMPNYYWIGLTDARTGSWEWVDKTPYVMVREEWMPNQPDDWSHHGLGGGEDCAHLHIDGRLNDDHCSRRYYFVCEY